MIASHTFKKFDPSRVPSPCFVIDEVALTQNLQQLQSVASASGAKLLLALKAFALPAAAPLVKHYLSGVCASGLHEARLGREVFGGAVHTYSPAYRAADLPELLKLSDHLVFNSLSQWQRFKAVCIDARQQRPQLRFGLRVNPGHSEVETPLYDPSAPGSRLGIPAAEFTPALLAGTDLDGITGLHFHTLCEQGFAPLARTLKAFEDQFGELLPRLDWVNFGGGHHITQPDYDRQRLTDCLRDFQQRYGVQVYLEPGEAIAIHTGVLVTEVLDQIRNQLDIALLDSSATCHMPDTLEMPYRAGLFSAGGVEAGAANELPHTYRLGGPSCLAGDVMGDYSFAQPLQIGQRLMFDDMAHYTMVKTTTFNGVPLPSIALWNSTTDALTLVREFGYADFRDRLG